MGQQVLSLTRVRGWGELRIRCTKWEDRPGLSFRDPFPSRSEEEEEEEEGECVVVSDCLQGGP